MQNILKYNKYLHKPLSKNTQIYFQSKILYLPKRPGERFASALTKISQNNKIIQRYGKINLKDYISSFIKQLNKYENS